MMIKRYKEFLISPLIITNILLIIYAFKGIYPFGSLTIANGDIGQAYMPFYYFLYDIVYNGKNIFYDYVLGMGSNMYGGVIADGLFNPTAFIIFLGSRDNIPYMLSFVLILKLAFIGVTSYILFYKLDKENKFYNLIFSVLYALSGYVLSYHTNLMWLDIVGLFPILILSIKYMFETSRVHWFAIVLALMLIFNYNLSFMVLMFIIFIVPIYIALMIKKEDRKKAIFNLMLGTVLSLGLSAFATVPTFMQVISSYRMSGTVVNTITNRNILYKIANFIFYSLPLYGYLSWFKYRKEDNKNFLCINLALAFSALIPILFERVNLLWHTGSYQMFPFRYGFIPTMFLYIGSLRYFGKYEKNEKIHPNQWKETKLITIILIIFAINIGILIGYNLNKSLPAFNMYLEIFIYMVTFCILIYVSNMSISGIQNEKIRKLLIILLTIFQIFVYVYAYVGVPLQFRGGLEWSDEQIFTSNEIYNKLNIKNSLYKIKDLTASTTENCSLVYDIPSMSTFLHIISKEQVLNCKQLGYSSRRTQINDFGGTIFSDAVYGIKYIMSKEELPSKLYTLICYLEDDVKVYEYNYILPIGILYKNQLENIPKNLVAFDAQNYLYKSLFAKKNDIIDELEDGTLSKNENNKYQYSFSIQNEKEVYLYTNHLITNIKINGKDIVIPIINSHENRVYPTQYCNGILDLGYFENGNVTLEFESNEEISKKDIKIGLLNLEMYYELFEHNNENVNIEITGNKIKVEGDLKEESNLFIPINYDKGWKSNSETNINKVYNTFIGLKLKQGYNMIELEFKPYLFNFSIIITFATILLMFLIYLIQKRFDICNLKWLMLISYIIGIIIYSVALFRVYIMSIFQTIIGFFNV